MLARTRWLCRLGARRRARASEKLGFVLPAEIPLVGQKVMRCSVDHAFRLHFGSGNQRVELIIETPFTLIDSDRELRLAPSHVEELGPALGLFDRTVKHVNVEADGALVVRFDGGVEMSIKPDDQYEAWQIVDAGGSMLICTPGGGLASFPGQT